MKKNTRAYLGNVIADAIMDLDAKDLLWHETIRSKVDLGSPITISLSDVNGVDFHTFAFSREIMERAKDGFEPRSDDGSHAWADELRKLADKIENASKKAWKLEDQKEVKRQVERQKFRKLEAKINALEK
jgi:hypothetical protein